jgi:hypothetical protein
MKGLSSEREATGNANPFGPTGRNPFGGELHRVQFFSHI